MRDAVLLPDRLVVTTDNSGAIGEKLADMVQVADELTAYFSARVTLLEQWAANAQPFTVILHNFSGENSWAAYQQGVEKVLKEASIEDIILTGSTETNMDLLQSAVAVTMLGKEQSPLVSTAGDWYTYGKPLVGNEVLETTEEVASLAKIRQALDEEIVHQIWPVGSKGILAELKRLFNKSTVQVKSTLDLTKSSGPSTVVLLKIPFEQQRKAEELFGSSLRKLVVEISD